MKRRIAIILGAGYGTRMYPFTKDTPKPLLYVGEKPVLDYIMDELDTLPKLEDIFIVSNAKFYDNYVRWKNNRKPKIKEIHLLNDGSMTNDDRLGAAGDLHFAFREAGEFTDALVVGGDNVFLFPIKPIWEAFIKGDVHRIAALQDKNRERLRRTGVLEISKTGKLIRLHEKPTDPPTNYFSPPLYFFKSTAKEHLSDYMGSKVARDASGRFVDYLCQKETVRAVKLERGRLDIGNMESFKKADQLLSQGEKKDLLK
ncbi:MAG: NTP transferase domain-containing protein [Candidatus Marinimicrobia bacterium]|nr:NTP transferase domain-containing protein [Candidatus Neomarinimicrobiota bacterium]